MFKDVLKDVFTATYLCSPAVPHHCAEQDGEEMVMD